MLGSRSVTPPYLISAEEWEAYCLTVNSKEWNKYCGYAPSPITVGALNCCNSPKPSSVTVSVADIGVTIYYSLARLLTSILPLFIALYHFYSSSFLIFDSVHYTCVIAFLVIIVHRT